MSSPEIDARCANFFICDTTVFLLRLPEKRLTLSATGRFIHLRQEAEACCGVAPEMLIREKKNADVFIRLLRLGSTCERPLKDLPGIGTRTAGAAMLADKRLDRSRGIHVSNRNDANRRSDGLLQTFPRFDGVVIG